MSLVEKIILPFDISLHAKNLAIIDIIPIRYLRQIWQAGIDVTLDSDYLLNLLSRSIITSVRTGASCMIIVS